jgi:protein TonB
MIRIMQGRLAIHRGRGFWGSRGAALAGIGLLHAGLLAVALQQRDVRREMEPMLVSVSLLTPRAAEPTRMVPSPQLRLEMPKDVVLLPPELSVENHDDPESATTAITAMSAPAAPDPAPVVEPARSEPIQVTRADYLRPPMPRYPPTALAARREGSVGLRVLVGEDGRVIDVVVERPSGFAPFDEAACNAVRAALFRPYTVNGQPRIVMIRIPIDFTLKRRGA